MEIMRGDVWYVESGYSTGSEQRAGRPAIVVSNDRNNESSPTVEVVYLTTQPKRDLPTHVTIRSIGRESIAICEQITTVSTERIGDYKGHITDAEMQMVDRAVLISLGLTLDVQPLTEVQSQPQEDNSSVRLYEVETRYETLQWMFNQLLDKLIQAGKVPA